MKKKICKNCKYYKKYEDCNYYGECTSNHQIYDTAYCYEKNTKKELIHKNLLLYMDYEYYNAGVEVGEEYGCVHFEKKEEVENG